MTLLGHELDLVNEIIKLYDLDSLSQQESLSKLGYKTKEVNM